METQFLAERELRYHFLAAQKVHIDRLWLKEASERHLRAVSWGGPGAGRAAGRWQASVPSPPWVGGGCRASSPRVPAARGVTMNILAASQVRARRGLPNPAPGGPAGG